MNNQLIPNILSLITIISIAFSNAEIMSLNSILTTPTSLNKTSISQNLESSSTNKSNTNVYQVHNNISTVTDNVSILNMSDTKISSADANSINSSQYTQIPHITSPTLNELLNIHNTDAIQNNQNTQSENFMSDNINNIENSIQTSPFDSFALDSLGDSLNSLFFNNKFNTHLSEDPVTRLVRLQQFSDVGLNFQVLTNQQLITLLSLQGYSVTDIASLPTDQLIALLRDSDQNSATGLNLVGVPTNLLQKLAGFQGTNTKITKHQILPSQTIPVSSSVPNLILPN